ncbi:MAG: SusC/RagA family TonB-linked outer membrane protein [Balneolaceae bacterium]
MGKTLRYLSFLFVLGLLFASLDEVAAQGAIEGVVTERGTGTDLPGVNVVIEELTIGAPTDANGRYRIENVPAGTYTLQARFLGFRTEVQEVTVVAGQTATVNFVLRASMIELDQVIVTGPVGGVERRAIGNTITQIDAVETVRFNPIPNVQALINGRAPGVVVMPGSGMVGAGSKIRIRGSSSINLSNDPLIYVDGVRVDNAQATGPAVQGFGSSVVNRLNDFNPDDIENIEILKGAAAATLYGTDASNGVILITTKRGNIGIPQFSYTARAGANYFGNKESRMFTNYWTFPDGRVESINLVQSERERGTPIFESGFLQGHNLNVSGGNELVRYFISADYVNEDGVEPTNNLERTGARANVTIFPAEGLDITANFGYSSGRTFLGREAGTGGVTWGAFFSTPNHAQEGDIRRGYRSFVSESYYEFDDFQDLNRLTASVQINYNPFDNWQHRITLGVDEVNEDNRTILENSPIYRLQAPNSLGFIAVDRRDVTSLSVDYSSTFRYQLSNRLTTRTSYGFQYFTSRSKFVSSLGEDFALPGLRSVNAAARTTGGETFSEQVSLGIFVEEQVGFDERMFFTAGLRLDDNSSFGDNFDIVAYPKAAYTWILSNENWFNVDFINSFRFRGAFGQTGQAPGPFARFQTFNPITGINDQPALSPGLLGNEDLGPERTTEFDLGFEAALLDDRISVEVSYFDATTRDAILFRDVAPSTGFAGTQPVNIGEIRNWGWEFMINTIPIQNRQWSWDLNLSFSTNDSKVNDLGGEETIILDSGVGVEHRLGGPLGGFYGVRLLDAQLDAQGNTIQESLICATPGGGSAPCFDGSGNFVAERVFIGPGIPKYEGAVNTSVTFRNMFRMGAVFDYKLGHYKWDATNRVRGVFGIAREVNLPLEHDPVDVVGLRNNFQFGGSAHTSPADFLRLRELTFSYFLQPDLVQSLGLRSATFTVAARNVWTTSKFSGLDPETMFLGGGRGGFVQFEQNNLPQLNQIVGTINIQF